MKVQIYSTCPKSSDATSERRDYLSMVREASTWSEAAGCVGTLIYTDNSLINPWLIAHSVMDLTSQMRPLVAVQPAYMHPYTAAKNIASLALMHGRATDVNIVAGGFRNDLKALGDTTPHDDRYIRAEEYATIMRQLLDGEAVTQDGRFYQLEGLSLKPSLPEGVQTTFLISGSSEAGMQAAEGIGATAIRYPGPPDVEDDMTGAAVPCGIRIGVIARERSEDAWKIALDRFPEDRTGQIAHAMAMKTSDSQWHQQLSEGRDAGVYWLHPFRNYNTFCPYLVGSFDEVVPEIRRYIASGYETFILDIPVDMDDIEHATRAINMAADTSTELAGETRWRA